MFDDARALGFQRPERAELPVAIYISAIEFGQAIAVINFAAGDAGRFVMRVGDDRRKKRSGAAGAVRVDGVPAGLSDGLAVIAAAFDAINHLPKFPTDIRGPKIAASGIETDAPRVSQAIS